ncbi:MAG: peptidylprolyl isomerase [Propionibacteriaceae bacterium]|nr:peptidylprolyl isomerase [Propionibacteriaceae bacterium]
MISFRILPALVVASLLPLAGCTPATVSGTGNGVTTTAPGSSLCRYEASGQPARAVDPPSTKDVAMTGTVGFVLNTNQGPVTITMDRSSAPCTVHSFEALAKQKFFDDTLCHRLVDSGIFVLQCGDPTGTGRGGPGYRFADEVKGSTTYRAGTVAMANAGPNTNGSQFFLVYADSELPPNYTVFGHLDEESLAVVNRIAVEGQDGSNPDGSGRPNNEARIIDVTQAQ